MYSDYSSIPYRYRVLIKDLEDADRITQVPLERCNELIQEAKDSANALNRLRNYEIEWARGEKVRGRYSFTELNDAYEELDRLTNYGKDNTKVTIVMKQDGRFVRGYHDGKWVYPSESPLATRK